MIKSVFNEDLRMSLRTAASQAGLHHRTALNFLKLELKPYRYKVQRHPEHNDLITQNCIRFASYSTSELRNNPEYFKRALFSDKWKLSLSRFFNKENCQLWVPIVQVKIIKGQTTDHLFWSGALYRKSKVIGLSFLENQNMTGETYQRHLRYFVLPNCWEYGGDTMFQHKRVPAHFPVLVPW